VSMNRRWGGRAGADKGDEDWLIPAPTLSSSMLNARIRPRRTWRDEWKLERGVPNEYKGVLHDAERGRAAPTSPSRPSSMSLISSV